MVDEIGFGVKLQVIRMGHSLVEDTVVKLVGKPQVVWQKIVIDILCHRETDELSLLILHIAQHRLSTVAHQHLHQHTLHPLHGRLLRVEYQRGRLQYRLLTWSLLHRLIVCLMTLARLTDKLVHHIDERDLGNADTVYTVLYIRVA